MNCSLRTKISFLMVIALALAVIPIISFTYTDVRESSAELEYTSFNNVALLVEDSINTHYLTSLNEQITTVAQCKTSLRRTSAMVQTMWQNTSHLPIKERALRLEELAKSLTQFDMHLDIFNNTKGLALNTNTIATLVHDTSATDFKGRNLKSILQDPMQSEGQFAVFYIHSASGEKVPVLIFCLPSPNQQDTIITGLVLAHLEEQAAATKQAIINNTQNKLDSLQLSDHTFIAIFSGNGKTLAFRGPQTEFTQKIIPDEALKQAKKEKHITYHADTIAEYGSFVFNISYIKVLDIYVIVAAPQSEIEASTTSLVRTLISIALIAVLISLICTLYFTTRLIAPLRTLTKKTHDLASFNFGHDNVEHIVDDLPTRQRDEVGQLAKAFATMAQNLSNNVRELMDTSSVKERMQGELNAATDIQMGILPTADAAPKLDNYEAAPFLEPAKEVGGDLYDFFIAPDGRQVVIIGDVSGKGVPAALFMSMTVTLCRYAISSGMSPAEAMVRINDQLSANNPSCMFVTLFIGLFDPETGSLEYANGGHCPPCIVSPEGNSPAFYADAMSGPLVGAMDGMDYFTQVITLEKGQRCLLYSDGVTEAMNESLQLFSDPHLLEVMTSLRHASPQELVDGVYQAILTHRGAAEPSDDITMLCFMRK